MRSYEELVKAIYIRSRMRLADIPNQNIEAAFKSVKQWTGSTIALDIFNIRYRNDFRCRYSALMSGGVRIEESIVSTILDKICDAIPYADNIRLTYNKLEAEYGNSIIAEVRKQKAEYNIHSQQAIQKSKDEEQRANQAQADKLRVEQKDGKAICPRYSFVQPGIKKTLKGLFSALEEQGFQVVIHENTYGKDVALCRPAFRGDYSRVRVSSYNEGYTHIEDGVLHYYPSKSVRQDIALILVQLIQGCGVDIPNETQIYNVILYKLGIAEPVSLDEYAYAVKHLAAVERYLNLK